MQVKLLIVCLALVCASHSIAAEESGRVDLVAAKRFAVARNLDVLSLRHEVAEKTAVAGQAAAPFFPTVGVAGGANTQNGGQNAVLGYGYLNLNIFRGFEDVYQSQIAHLEAEVSRIKLKQTEFRVGLDVEEQFHKFLLKKASIKLRQEAIELNQKHRAMAQARAGAGMATSSDVMEFDIRNSLLRSDLELLKQELEECRIRLRKLLGEEVGATIEPVGTLQHQHLKGDLMEYLNRVRDTSESVQIASKELAKATVESHRWRSKWLPTLDVEAQAGYLDLDARPSDGSPGVRALVVAKIDLFQGFRSTWERREGEAKLQKAEATLKHEMLTALNDIEVSFRRLKTMQHRVDLESENAERSEKYYKAVIGEYRRGTKNSADVKMAAEGLYEARLRHETYKHDFLETKLALEKSTGAAIETEIMASEAE